MFNAVILHSSFYHAEDEHEAWFPSLNFEHVRLLHLGSERRFRFSEELARCQIVRVRKTWSCLS